jgi:glutamine synthetase
MENLVVGQLVQQEPDASSFPNGGLEIPLKLVVYSMDDPTSPAFIIGTTLCIPTVLQPTRERHWT